MQKYLAVALKNVRATSKHIVAVTKYRNAIAPKYEAMRLSVEQRMVFANK